MVIKTLKNQRLADSAQSGQSDLLGRRPHDPFAQRAHAHSAAGVSQPTGPRGCPRPSLLPRARRPTSPTLPSPSSPPNTLYRLLRVLPSVPSVFSVVNFSSPDSPNPARRRVTSGAHKRVNPKIFSAPGALPTPFFAPNRPPRRAQTGDTAHR